MEGFVYKWVNTTNGMYYIGSHKGKPNDRYIGSGRLFKQAYKETPESFTREIIYQGESFRELEDFVLKTLNARNDEKSYNQVNFCSPSIDYKKNKPVSEETREKIRQIRLGSKHTDESIAYMRTLHKGEDNAFYGKTHTEESKRKMSEAKKNDPNNKETLKKAWAKSKRAVYCGYLNQSFDSLKKCSIALGLSRSYVSNMLTGKSNNLYDIKYL